MSAVLEPIVVTRQPHEYYSPERKAEVLAIVKAHDGNVLRASQETGIHHSTIRYWLEDPRYSELQKQKQKDLANECEADARYYFQLAREKLPDAPYNHLMTGAAIAVDKMQLLRSLPTSIIEHQETENLTLTLDMVLEDFQDK